MRQLVGNERSADYLQDGNLVALMPHGSSASDSRMPFLHEPLLSGAVKAGEAQRSTLGRNQDRLVQFDRGITARPWVLDAQPF